MMSLSGIKEKLSFLMAFVVIIAFLFTTFVQADAGNSDFELVESIEQDKDETVENLSMSDKQLSAISMLNYMTVLSQEINSSSNSKLYLDNAYSSIVNNINPNAVDNDSMSQIKSLLNTIDAYQSIETKRERLQYIYEQNQAKAIKKAIPSPMSVLNVVQAANPAKALVSVIYMAVDSKSSYDSYISEVEDKYLQDGWVLDDAATENLHESRSDAFAYMVEMCNKNDLDGKLALNEKSVEEFVKWETEANTVRRIDFLEKNKETYRAYGKYWLVLARSYYDVEDYEKCIDAIDEYESMNIVTFRKDHDLAKTLSVGLSAANEIYSDDEYIDKAEHYLTLILANIETGDDWALRYLAAQTYMDLYKKTKGKEYLQKAYDLTQENVNYLIDEQYAKNNAYMAEIRKQEVKKNDSDTKKKEVKNYNKWLEEERKTELPPIYQPLVVNCELLFGLADELKISASEKNKINMMLHSEDKQLFLIEPLENRFMFDTVAISETPDITFDGMKIYIPAKYIAQGTTIRVTVDSTIYDDWILNSVDRGDKTTVDSFIAKYDSKLIKKCDYKNGDKVNIEVIPPVDSLYDKETYTFSVTVRKKLKIFTEVIFELEN